MNFTTSHDVFLRFDSSYQDKNDLPISLLIEWLRKANGEFGIKLQPLNFDNELLMYDAKLDDYAISILATLIKKYYIQREVSKVNKIVRIVGKDISIDGNDNTKKYSKIELDDVTLEVERMIQNKKPTAYS